MGGVLEGAAGRRIVASLVPKSSTVLPKTRTLQGQQTKHKPRRQGACRGGRPPKRKEEPETPTP